MGWRADRPEPELARNWSADGFTPLHYAAFFGQEDAARLLLERGRGGRARRHPRDAAASAAAGSRWDREAAARGGRDPNAAQDGGYTPLHSAAQNDDRESAEALLAAGADPSIASDDGKTPAQLAGDSTRDLFG